MSGASCTGCADQARPCLAAEAEIGAYTQEAPAGAREAPTAGTTATGATEAADISDGRRPYHTREDRERRSSRTGAATKPADGPTNAVTAVAST